MAFAPQMSFADDMFVSKDAVIEECHPSIFDEKSFSACVNHKTLGNRAEGSTFPRLAIKTSFMIK
jgi:hypothetical protein